MFLMFYMFIYGVCKSTKEVSVLLNIDVKDVKPWGEGVHQGSLILRLPASSSLHRHTGFFAQVLIGSVDR